MTAIDAWRVGRHVGRTIYRNDQLVGLMDTPELADQVVKALNLMSDRYWCGLCHEWH